MTSLPAATTAATTEAIMVAVITEEAIMVAATLAVVVLVMAAMEVSHAGNDRLLQETEWQVHLTHSQFVNTCSSL